MSAKPGSLEICMAQKANMEAIFHSVADGILTLDNDLQVVHANRAALRMLGTGEAELAGRPVGDVLRGGTVELEPLLRRTLADGRSIRAREGVLETRGGDVRVELSTGRLVDLSGDVGGAVLVLRDITRVRDLEARLGDRTSLHAIVGRSHAMQEIFALIEQVAPTESTVLIQGESGTGKELIADAIHRSSRRADGPFVKVNCSALSEGLLESELFGHVKGSYTGAHQDRKGRFELASGGTLLLDEVGDLSDRIQVKLLRVLQEREIERVGDSRTRAVDVRILAATHRPLRRLVEEERFREDLFYRLNVIPLRVPPLRERREDVPLLAARFLEELRGTTGRSVERISPDALRVLMDHRWPGNVRELRNAVEHAMVKCRGPVLLAEDLPRELIEESAGVTRTAKTRGADARSVERDRIRVALEESGWNRTRAAERLGIDRSTLWRRMRKLGIGEEETLV
jgi:PAS domain S-box-containing protein